MKPSELKAFRKFYGYSQTELAKLLGVSYMTLSKYEHGRNPIPDRLIHLMTLPDKVLRLCAQEITEHTVRPVLFSEKSVDHYQVGDHIIVKLHTSKWLLADLCGTPISYRKTKEGVIDAIDSINY